MTSYVRSEGADGELVADRDIALRANLDLAVLIHDPTGQLLAGLDAFDDDDAHRITLVVHNEMNHGFPGDLASDKADYRRCSRPAWCSPGH